MTISSRKAVVQVTLILVILLTLGAGVAVAQSAPVPTPAPDASPAEAAPPVDTPMVQPPFQGAPLTPASDRDDGRTITNGKTLKGRINPINDYDWYYFYATSGQAVTLQVFRKGNSLDPQLLLHAPDGSMLTSDNNSGGNLNPLISNYPMNVSGRYGIGVVSHNQQTSGNYSLRMDMAGADKDDNRLMTSGKNYSGKILPNSDTDGYFFEGIEGQRASIQMNRNGGTLDSYLYLYGPDGSQLASDDDSGEGLNALIADFTLPEAGLYHVLAMSFLGDSGGGYKLRLDMTAPNLALNKPSTAWNWTETYYRPEYGNDGDLGSRWAGYDGTNWWWVDLGSPMTFNQVKINWEAAYATEYFVGWSNAPECLGTYEGFNYSANSIGYMAHNLGLRTARCVAIRMDTALYWATNYSFWEFEVYHLANNAAPLDSLPANVVLVDAVPAADFGDEALVELELLSLTD